MTLLFIKKSVFLFRSWISWILQYENDFRHHHTLTGTQCWQYLSCYWPDLDQTLNKGSLEHIQQITTVTTTFVQTTFVLGTFVHIRNKSISKLNTFDISLVQGCSMDISNEIFKNLLKIFWGGKLKI